MAPVRHPSALRKKSSTGSRHQYSSSLRSLEACKADPLLGMIAEFQTDNREHKLDLGVGIYKNESGVTPTLAAIKNAERILSQLSLSKVYEGPLGNTGFCEKIAGLVTNDERHSVSTDNRFSIATPGGCGALFQAMSFFKRLSPDSRIWMSNPTWPNHKHIASNLGLNTERYRYVAEDGLSLDFEGFVEDVKRAAPGDFIILQGVCHNPTGIDLSNLQWQKIGKVCASKGLIPLIDIAYHGLGRGLNEDLVGVRAFLKEVASAFISYSCSKNFGLYRERAGCLMVQAENAKQRDVIGSHLKDISRASYSMPPAHGCAVVEYVLQHDILTSGWQTELGYMQQRIRNTRDSLADALIAATGNQSYDRIKSQNGMFTVLRFQDGEIDRLKREHGIYVPGSGRINIAGLNQKTLISFVEKASGSLKE